MSRKYVRKTEKTDPERGDTLTLKKKEVEQFFTPGYPVKVRHAVFDALLGWFVGASKTHLDNPVVDGILQTLIKTQMENVQNYLDKCETNRENVLSRNRGTTVPLVTPGGTTVTTHNNNSRNKHEHNKDMFVSTVGDGASRAVAAPPTPLSVKEAKKFLAMNAPQISSLPEMRVNGKPTMQCHQFLTADVDDVVELIGNEIFGDDRDEGTCTTFDEPIAEMARRMEAIGKEAVFRKVLVKAMVDSDDDEVDNPAAFVMARCKKGEAAIMATNKR